MQKILEKVIFFYSAVASLLITIGTVGSATNTLPVIFVILFLPVTSYFLVEFIETNPETEMLPGKGESILFLAVFIFFLGFGIKNVMGISIPNPTSTASTLIFKAVPSPTPTPTPKPIIMITVKIPDGSTTVNIREKPTIYSNKIAQVKNGDKLEEIAKITDWYEVKINGLVGYISKLYVVQ